MPKLADLAGQRFGLLTVVEKTANRQDRYWLWRCRCDCGGETDVTEDSLTQGNSQSCGCLKREAQQAIPTRLHRVDGTCVEWLEKRKHRSDNTSGFRGVYPRGDGHYRAVIGFQGKRYYLGSYDSFAAAVAARLEAEELLHGGFVKAWRSWQQQTADLPKAQRPSFRFEEEKTDGHFVVKAGGQRDAP